MAASTALVPTPPPPPPVSDRIHVFWHEGMLRHDPGRGVFDTGIDPGFLDVLEPHPENPDRVRNMVSILKRGPIAPFLTWNTGRPAVVSEVLSFHTPEYINELVEADTNGGKVICAGTFLNPGSWEAALLASGTTLSAMKYILDGNGKLSYALVRPPGHHAQPTQGDGYCFLNNAGLAVQLALDSGCEKVAVVDIDVHYGNGTAEGFYRSDRVLTISLHMNHGSWGPSHPQSGTVNELGEGKGFGYNLNVPLPDGTGDRGYEYAVAELVVPAVQTFEPDIMVFVIGQDSSAFDPNGRQCLTMKGYRAIGRLVRDMADKHCNGRVLIVQEGGYHLTYSAYCLHATLEGVLNFSVPLLSDPVAYYPEDETYSTKVIQSIKRYQKDNVPFLKEEKSEGKHKIVQPLQAINNRPIKPKPKDSNAEAEGHRTRRIWSNEEEIALIALLKEVSRETRFKQDNVWRSGYIIELQNRMLERFPGTDLRANPHIVSKIDTWKRWYASVTTLLNTTGFSWNESLQTVECDNEEVWKEHEKRDRNVKYVCGKAMPYYHDWCEIWGKDRAAGNCVPTATEVLRNVTNSSSRNEIHDVEGPPVSSDGVESPTPTSAKSSKTGEKRKRPPSDITPTEVDKLTCTLDVMTGRMEQTIENLGNRLERRSSQRAQLNEILDAITFPGPFDKFLLLTEISSKPSLLDNFFDMKPVERATFAHFLLQSLRR